MPIDLNKHYLRRSGKLDHHLATQLRRGERNLADAKFEINRLEKELQKIKGTDGEDRVVLQGSSNKDGLKSLQKDLKDVRCLVEELEHQLKELISSKFKLVALIEVERSKLEELEPSSTKIRPEAQLVLDPLEASARDLNESCKIATSRIVQLQDIIEKRKKEWEKSKQVIKGLNRDVVRAHSIKAEIIEEIKRIQSNLKSKRKWEEEVNVAVGSKNVVRKELEVMRLEVKILDEKIGMYDNNIKLQVLRSCQGKVELLKTAEEKFHRLIESRASYRDKIEEAKVGPVHSQKELQNRLEKLVEVQDLVKLDHYQTSKLNRRILTLSKELESLQSTHSTLVAQNQGSAFQTARDHNRCIEATAAPKTEMERNQLEVLTYPVRSKIFDAEKEKGELKEVERVLVGKLAETVDASRIRYDEELKLVRREGEGNKEKVRELEEKLGERVGSRKTEVIPRTSSSRNAKSNSSLTSTPSSSSTILKLISTVKTLSVEWKSLSDENMKLVLELADK